MTIHQFFPMGFERYIFGGVCIGLAVAILYLSTGRQGGASSFYSTTWSWVLNTPFFKQSGFLNSRQWRVLYAWGMLIGGILFVGLGFKTNPAHLYLWRLILGGLLVGFGTRLGSGCTSGHGICGTAALSVDSIVMVITFLVTAILTASILAYFGVAL